MLADVGSMDINVCTRKSGPKSHLVADIDPTPSQIGKELKRLRKAVGLSQSQVARALGVTEKTVTRWEAGKQLDGMRFTNAVKLAELYHVDVNALARIVGLSQNGDELQAPPYDRDLDTNGDADSRTNDRGDRPA